MVYRFRVALLALLIGLTGVTFVAARRAVARPRPPVDFWTKTANIPQADISGHIVYAPGAAKGTVFLCHGYTQSKEVMAGYNWMANEGWDLVSFDFREHGKSTTTRHLSTLGYYEMWDVKAAVDYAEAVGLPKPYVIYGNSMGASVGLRWAAQDKRIKGVMAVSPYANAYTASKQFLTARTRIPLPVSPAWLTPGYAKMLRQVDIPTAVRQRDDLRIDIMAGEYDCFPLSDDHAILNASASPADMKHLYVAPGLGHGGVWSWRGDSVVPSHDAVVKAFLKACE